MWCYWSSYARLHSCSVGKLTRTVSKGRQAVQEEKAAVSNVLSAFISDDVLKSTGFHLSVKATLSKNELQCLLDTGAGASILPTRLMSDFTVQPSCLDIQLQTAGGKNIPVHGTAEVNVVFAESSVEFEHRFIVADVVTEPIIGADFLRKYDMEINFKDSVLRAENFSTPLILSSCKVCEVVLMTDVSFPTGIHEILVQAKLVRNGKLVSCSSDSLFCPREELARDLGILPAAALVDGTTSYIPVKLLCVKPQAMLRRGKILGHIEQTVDIARLSVVDLPCSTVEAFPSSTVDLSSTELTGPEKIGLCALIDSYADIFSTGEGDLGRTSVVRHEIPTGDDVPVHQRNYRQPFHLRQEVQRQVDVLLEQGLVEPSRSPWCSPVLMVPKKDGTFRFCVDFRKLNSKTQWIEYPMPRVDECLESLSGSTMFTTLDLASGYWQVEVNEGDRQKTAFSTTQGHFQFVTMPMGLKGAPATFQQLMNLVLRGLHWTSVLVYLDDIIIFAPSFSQHQERLRTVFDRLRGAGLKLKPSKCYFAQPSVKFLGHVVSAEGVHTDPEKARKIEDWPTPQNVHEVRSFMGLATYYRRFIRDFSELAAPLTDLTGKRVSFKWTEDEAHAFECLKKKLVSAPVLAHPLFDKDHPFVLKTDASGIGLGAILSQVQEGKERVVAYASRKLNKAEQSYGIPEREALAMVWGINHFRPFLYGQRFVIVTDHQPLTFLKTIKDPKGRLARWIHELSAYDYDVKYKPGRSHNDADALSRCPGSSSATVLVAVTSIIYNKEAVCKAQAEDPVLKVVMDKLRTGCTPRFRGRWMKGPLNTFRRIWSQLEMNNSALIRHDGLGRRRLVVPGSLRTAVLQLTHDAPSSGHMGTEKSFQRVQERFYWPGYARDVEAYVRSCSVCQQRQGSVPKPSAALQQIQVGSPFEMIAMDMLELPRSERGNKYCLVISDYFTRWPEVFPLPDQQATTVARVLVDGVFARHGLPATIHSDQGRSFENEVIKEICRAMGITKVRTSPYHPESDGLVERLNRTLLSMLSKYVADKPSDWDQWLGLVVMAYRTAKHSSTGFSPFQLLYGRDSVTPADVEFHLPTSSRTRNQAEYLQDLQSNLRVTRELMEENEAFAKSHQARNHKVVETKTYESGDQVLLHDPATRHGTGYKLRRPWTGPFIVMEKLGSVNYRIKKVGHPRSVVVHYNRLKPFLQRDDEVSSQSVGTPTACLDASPSTDSDVSPTSEDFASPPASPVMSTSDSDQSALSTMTTGTVVSSEVDEPLALDHNDSESTDSLADDEGEDSDEDSIPVQRQRRRPRWQDDYHLY